MASTFVFWELFCFLELPDSKFIRYFLCSCHWISHFFKKPEALFSSVQFSHSVMSDSLQPHGLQHTRPPCPSPTPGVYQTHVHQVGDAIQPSHSLLSPSPPALNLSQHQGLFQWVNSSHEVAKVLEFQLQHQSFQRTPRTDLFKMDWLDLLAVQETPRVFSNTTVLKNQFFGTQLLSQSISDIHTWPLEKP